MSAPSIIMQNVMKQFLTCLAMINIINAADIGLMKRDNLI